MALRKNKGAPVREACIDDSSLNLLLVIVAVILLFSIMLSAYFTVALISREDVPERNDNDTPASADGDYPFYEENITVDLPPVSEALHTIDAETIYSEYAIVIDATENEIVASLRGNQPINPASLTKVMTLIVVVENLKSSSSLDEVLTIEHGQDQHSGFGFKPGDKLTVRDLLYASILLSDGVACLTLADYIAGSEANFVMLMNEKVQELGLKNTFFKNCTGLYQEGHQSTCRDMGIIMAYAIQNRLCASVLSTKSFPLSDNYMPETGNTYTLWHQMLVQQMEDKGVKLKNGTIIGAKSGYTEENTSGRCLITHVKGKNNHDYIIVTAKAPTGDPYKDEKWLPATKDLVALCDEYVK